MSHANVCKVVASLYGLCVLLATSTVSAAALWQDISSRSSITHHNATYGRQLTVDAGALSDLLLAVDQYTPSRIALPMPDGRMRDFEVINSPVMAAELATKYPAMQAFKVKAVDDSHVHGRLDIGPNGFHAYIRDHGETIFIDPKGAAASRYYISYYQHAYAEQLSAERKYYACGMSDELKRKGLPKQTKMSHGHLSSTPLAKTEGSIQNYRLAVATTYEYGQQVAPGNPTAILNEVMTAIARVNAVYEVDLGIHLELVANNNLLISTSSNDGYTNSDLFALLGENQTRIDATIGAGSYDVGHVLNTAGGGLAGLGVVCEAGAKARGVSGAPNPTGNAFYIDLLAHELGHQFGANHSFNGTSGSCGLNRNPATAFEPGSGITIMGYSGICDAENIAVNSIATMHAGSIDEIVAYTRSGAGACSNPGANTGNIAPVVNAGPDFTIPGGTPFELTGSATDTDTLSYQWEQMDAGAATNANSYGQDVGSNALFRSFDPVSTSTRVFPRMSNIINNTTDKAETIPTQSRNLNLRLTVRDKNGGVDKDDVVISVDGANSGPFEVLQPNTAMTINSTAGVNQTIEWNVACTDMAPVNCSNVDLSYTTDDGMSFIPLVADVQNNGAVAVDFNGANTSNVRIKISCSNNVFFDISDVPITLSTAASGPSSMLDPTMNLNNGPCGTEVALGTTGGLDIEPNDFAGVAQFISLPFLVTGGVDDTLDFSDMFRFNSTGGVYQIVLSNYGTNDLDLYLIDEDGINVVAASETATGITESINVGLASGKPYYVQVVAFSTGGLPTSYSLDVQQRGGASSSSSSDSSSGGLAAFALFGGAVSPGLLFIAIVLFAIRRMSDQLF